MLMMTSCATFKPAKRTVLPAFLDYRPYMSAGFFISPNPYMENCENLGELAIVVYPAQVEIDELNAAFYDGVIYRNMKFYGYERVPYEILLDQAVEQAKKAGADGLVNFKIQKIEGLIPQYMVTGVCIKR